MGVEGKFIYVEDGIPKDMYRLDSHLGGWELTLAMDTFELVSNEDMLKVFKVTLDRFHRYLKHLDMEPWREDVEDVIELVNRIKNRKGQWYLVFG